MAKAKICNTKNDIGDSWKQKHDKASTNGFRCSGKIQSQFGPRSCHEAIAVPGLCGNCKKRFKRKLWKEMTPTKENK